MAFENLRAELWDAAQHNWKGKAFVIGIAITTTVLNQSYEWSLYRIVFAIFLLFVVVFDQVVLKWLKSHKDEN